MWPSDILYHVGSPASFGLPSCRFITGPYNLLLVLRNTVESHWFFISLYASQLINSISTRDSYYNSKKEMPKIVTNTMKDAFMNRLYRIWNKAILQLEYLNPSRNNWNHSPTRFWLHISNIKTKSIHLFPKPSKSPKPQEWLQPPPNSSSTSASPT